MLRSDALEAFLAFSESLNFTRAAEALHISQPALHVKVQKLAREIGQPLYSRAGRTLRLTPAGERLATFAREQAEQSDMLLDELRGGGGRWPTVLAAGSGAYLYLLGPAISDFIGKGRYPLKLLTGDRDRTLALVTSGEAHLGVAALGGLPAGLESEPLTEVGQVLAMPKDHPLARRRRIALQDLESTALVVPPPDRPHRMMLNHRLMDAGVTWQVAVEAGGWDLMLHFVGLGVGLAVVNGCCRLPLGLVAKPLPELPPVRYQVIARPSVPAHAGAAALKSRLLAKRDAWRRSR